MAREFVDGTQVPVVVARSEDRIKVRARDAEGVLYGGQLFREDCDDFERDAQDMLYAACVFVVEAFHGIPVIVGSDEPYVRDRVKGLFEGVRRSEAKRAQYEALKAEIAA